MAVVGIGLLAGGAMADIYNNRPITTAMNPLIGPVGVNPTYPNEPLIQNILNDAVGVNGINSVTGQSNVAIWKEAEFDVAAYLITLHTGGNGQLGIYSFSNPSKVYDFGIGTGSGIGDQVGFNIKGDLGLYVNNVKVVENFGTSFGFYWKTGNTKYYTEDTKNSNNIARALTYQIADGLSVKIGNDESNAEGNNDWILAFEDGTDFDFNDAVFYMEDLQAVPEPATMVLFGTGILGLAGIARRRKSN